LLAALLASPRRYLSVEALAARMTRPGAYPVDTHSIEQTICTLRRKLGESARRPRVLLTKRGLGYGIFPEEPKPPKTAPKASKR
jgi:DNA-binding response OmpR family regulator